MLGNEAQAASSTKLLDPASAANTAAATSGWVDVRAFEGDLMFVNQVGALTGSITWTIQDATDGAGAGAAGATNTATTPAPPAGAAPGPAGVTPNEGAYDAGAANQIQKRTVAASAVRGWVRCVGTIVTGPALVAASLHARPKNF
jgi:hypothetical protein